MILEKKILKTFLKNLKGHFRRKVERNKNGVKMVPDTPVSEYTKMYKKNRKNCKNEFCVFHCLAPFS